MSTVNDVFKDFKNTIEAMYPFVVKMSRLSSGPLVLLIFIDTRTKKELKLKIDKVSLKYTTTHQAIMKRLDDFLEENKHADTTLYKTLKGNG